jgi:hypothetical protein
MTYSERLTITLPAALADIAATIARSLDPDAGGEFSFAPSEDGLTISCTTPCEPMFLAQAEYMMLHPEALHAAVSADYATRWPDIVAPTLADCEAFCAGIVHPEGTPG